MECWFLDVGQGSCNVILLGDGRAIIIDCGPKGTGFSKRLTPFLKRHVTTIAALIISHNDKDHWGSLSHILSLYPKAIENIYLIADRPANDNKVFSLYKSEKEKGNFVGNCARLEAKNDHGSILYSCPTPRVEVQIFYPTFVDNIETETTGKKRPNNTCAILRLCCEGRAILFSGDATEMAWEALIENMPGYLPLNCDIATVPHHGANLTNGNEQDEEAFQDKLYSEIINTEYGIISVGSANTHRHPSSIVVSALARNNVKIMCTQMTTQCCNDLESIRSDWLKPEISSDSSLEKTLTRLARRSRKVACAGTVIAEIANNAINISVWNEQQHYIEIKRRSMGDQFHPLCKLES